MSDSIAAAAAALILLNQEAARRVSDLRELVTLVNHDDSDKESDSPSPIFDYF